MKEVDDDGDFEEFDVFRTLKWIAKPSVVVGFNGDDVYSINTKARMVRWRRTLPGPKALSADATRLVYGEDRLGLVDTLTGKDLTSGEHGGASQYVWAPDNKSFAAIVDRDGDTSEVRIFSGGELVSTLEIALQAAPFFGSDLQRLAWSPDAKQLALALDDEIQIWSVETPSVLHSVALSGKKGVFFGAQNTVVGVTCERLVFVDAPVPRPLGEP